MKYFLIFVILISLLFAACRPSARFSTSNSDKLKKIEKEQNYSDESSVLSTFIQQWMYTPYKYGGMSKAGVDCSGFSSIAMREVFGISIPRTAEDQYNAGEKVRDGWQKVGDLVFFKNVRGHGIDHVGIFLGSNRFAHASTNNGVIISDLDEDYYQKRYVGSRRYLK
jgi:cell wall-associated NlpC family hydrolase